MGTAAAASITGRATAAPPPIITPEQAKHVVTDWFALSYQASTALDPALIAQAESPPLLTIDDADFKYRAAEMKPYENLVEHPSGVTVYVPRQTTYPAQFLSKISYPGHNVQYFVFVRETADAKWRTPYQASAPGFPKLPSPIKLDRSGYAMLVAPDAKGLVLAPERLGTRLTGYFSRSTERSLPSAKPFRAGPATTDNMTAIRARAREVPAKYTFSVTDGPPAAYRTANGGAVTFFAYESSERTTAPPGGTLRVADLGLPGPQLAPGEYVSVSGTRMTLVAAADPPKHKEQGLITVLGRYTGALTVDGVPATLTQS